MDINTRVCALHEVQRNEPSTADPLGSLVSRYPGSVRGTKGISHVTRDIAQRLRVLAEAKPDRGLRREDTHELEQSGRDHQ